jgi:ubiquinone/menaquinone biosynthesis C-methylase UbiE
MPPAWLYDAVMKPLDRLGLADLRRRLAEDARGATLEVGAGTGLNLRFYRATASPLVALDLDQQALLRARERIPGAQLIRASVEALPFRPGVFDVVNSALVFCTVGHPARGFEEVRRVLRATGEVRLLEHVRPNGAVLGWLAGAVTPLWRHVAGGCHLDRLTRQMVADAGFEETEARVALRGAVLELRARPAATSSGARAATTAAGSPRPVSGS